jgi:GNAT superfamily N-acetyltransferase
MLSFKPLTAERWPDLERLFGERGACAGCWCMWWRLTRKQFKTAKGRRNRAAFKRIVDSGAEPGVLAYDGGEPVGWCAVGPRESYPLLQNSRVLARLDEQPVWSVTCLFVARPFRRKGISAQLLRAAATHATEHGALLLEGYPVEPRQSTVPDVFAWTGLASAFRRAGFREVTRRSTTRPIMRLGLKPRRRRGHRGNPKT